ncbi:MAG: prolyl oligopeptidase family serine peptidase [Candidatus Lokiarchaeota archaeon]|nr:prolyl oligopeptidase family serine peptidase [Candidatus Lokiarchaeota archaeon]
MLSKSSSKKKEKINFIIGLIVVISFLIIPLLSDIFTSSGIKDSSYISVSANGDNFDILDFWENEIERVNNTPLNIVYGDNRTILHSITYSNKIYELHAQDISFTSPNWVGAQPQNLTLYGVLLYPNIIKSRNPGALCMHGLNGKIEDAFDLAIPYLEKGFIVLCHSHPGHGKSNGAEPESGNLYYEGAYNESAHFYLTLCGAIQGLRVLENLPLVNNSQIMVTGKSYGGLNAMWLAGIAGERIAGVTAYIAIGDIAKNLLHPDKLIFWLLGKNVKDIPDSYLTNQLLRFDPIYYLKSTKLPPIMWQIGTNDDFFHYSSIKGTFDAVQHTTKFLQIFPNDHHGFPGFEGSSKFFIDFILNDGPLPPKINITNVYKTQNIRGDNLCIALRVNSSEEIDSLQIVYRYSEIIGTCWERKTLIKTDGIYWEGEISPTIFSSHLDYYIIVNLKNMTNVWFSSEIFSAGIMKTNLTIPFVIIILIIVAIPLVLSIRRKFQKINETTFEEISREKHKLIVEISLIFVLDFIYYLSIILPWIVYESGEITLDHIYFFNNLYTWKLNFGEIAPYLTTIFFIASIINSQLNFISLRLSAITKLIYPLLLLVFISLTPFISGALDPSSLVSNFGITFPGIGPFLMIISAILLFFVGRWERRNKIALGLVVKKSISWHKFRKRISKKYEFFRQSTRTKRK